MIRLTSSVRYSAVAAEVEASSRSFLVAVAEVAVRDAAGHSVVPTCVTI